MGTLDDPIVVPKLVSRVLKVGLPRSGPLMKDDINGILSEGWTLSTSYYDSARDEVRFIFTRPKKQGA